MEKHFEHRKSSGSFFAWVLIILGTLWFLKHHGWDINFPNIGAIFSGMVNFFSNFAHWSTSAIFPLIIIFLGIMMIVGRKFLGALLLILLFMMILPGFLIIPGILLVVFLPIVLIIVGIVVLSNLF
jgi:hypothetical protein